MIEVGEPLYYYIIVAFIASLSFMVGVQFGSMSVKEQKIPTDYPDQSVKKLN